MHGKLYLRFLGLLKKMVQNKARVEGSICEAYINLETSHFCTYYFASNVPCMRNRNKRNEDEVEQDDTQPTLSVFRPQGRPSGRVTPRWLTDEEYNAAHLHVLLNCEEVQPYIGLVVNISYFNMFFQNIFNTYLTLKRSVALGSFFTQEKREHNPYFSDQQVDALIATQFASWFRNNVS